MRFISTNVHGIFDYLIGAFLIAMPWMFGFAVIGGPQTWLSVIVGASIIAYSLLTDYEWGLAKVIDMRAHLVLDVLAGLTILFSYPFLGFFDVLWWQPHLVVAVVLIAGAALTYKTPERRRPYARTPESVRQM